ELEQLLPGAFSFRRLADTRPGLRCQPPGLLVGIDADRIHVKSLASLDRQVQREEARIAETHRLLLKPITRHAQDHLSVLLAVSQRGRGSRQEHGEAGQRESETRHGQRLLRRRSRRRKKRTRASRWPPSVATSMMSVPAERASCRNASRRWRAISA